MCVCVCVCVYSRRSMYIRLSVVRVIRCEVHVSSLCVTYNPQE